MELICLDTSFVIDFLRNDEKAVDLIKKLKGEFVTTPITMYEIYLGLEKKRTFPGEREKTIELFNRLRILPASEKAMKEAAQITKHLEKKGSIINVLDILIAGMMKAEGCARIITQDKHFSRITGLQSINI